VDDHSLRLLEFGRVCAAISEHATCDAARRRLMTWRPLADSVERERECGFVGEAIRRTGEPGEWCDTGTVDVLAWLEQGREEPLDGEALIAIREWLDAGRATIERWKDPEIAERHANLAERIGDLPVLDPLRKKLNESLEPDGRVSDAASPALKRARAELSRGERDLEQRVGAWARGFGENAYVTRHADRFVALVPASGFQRRRGIVHDVSGSGQSLFVEPLEACEANNRLIEARAEVVAEERRVLAELSGAVWERRADVAALVGELVWLDTLRARARWARALGAIPIAPGGDRLSLRMARHPLLAMSRGADTVPLDLDLGEGGRLLIVSGPNMGGKTILLKTVGLSVALAHSALPVPCSEGSRVPKIDRMVVDLGDEQSVDLGLSTYAAHLARLAEMAEAASPVSLLLADELGAGTDPEEGAALGRALIEHSAARGAWGVMTSHLGSLKHLAGEVPGVVNGSMEFDLDTLTPRFRFISGVPGASHALSVAERLGFPADLLDRARTRVSDESRALERLIADLHALRGRLEDEIAAARAAREQSERAAEEHHQAAETFRHDLEALRGKLTRESDGLLARARELWQTVQREARRADKSRAGAETLRGAIESAERDLAGLNQRVEEALPAHARVALPADAIDPGRQVRVTDLGVIAQVVSPPDPEGKVVLKRGNWTIHSHVTRLAPADAESAPLKARASASWETQEAAPSLEIDLRGMEVEEAIRTVDEGLDRAILAGLTELRIVHGIGKGILRAAVERHLRGHPQVQHARLGEGHEGGRGATVATLR
jgi:DNA mismatch repair protein MutS2